MTNDNEDVVSVERSGDKVLVTPLAAGVANITFVRVVSETIYYSPVPAFVTETLVVTVT